MSHYKIYVLKTPEEKISRLKEDEIYEEIKHYASYAEEEEISVSLLERLKIDLESTFGTKNVQKNGNCFTISHAGAIHYFDTMRQKVNVAIQNAMQQPVENFIKTDIEHPNWWQIKEMLESNYDSHFYLKDYDGCETRTRFAESVLYLTKKHRSITLEVTQVFNFHT